MAPASTTKPAYKPSESRYDGGGQVMYLVYTSPQPLSKSKSSARTRVKRMYFPADAKNIKASKPAMLERRTGSQVYGVEVTYRYRQDRKAGPVYSDRTKVVSLPEGAKGIRLTKNPPEGPLMAVA
jgi:hypothetical protein